VAAGAAVDREGFRLVLSCREVSVAARDRERPCRDVLAGRPSIIEEDKHHSLSSQLDCRLSQSLRHAANAWAGFRRWCSAMRSARRRSFTILRAISSVHTVQGSFADFRPQSEQW